MQHLTTILAGILVVATVSARDIIVSPDDSLAKARDAARSGDRIILRGGTYRLGETLVLGPKNSGVTWMAFKKELPVISGGIVVTGWTADTNGRFKATVNLDNFRQLWVNGQRAQRTRAGAPAGLNPWSKVAADANPGTNMPVTLEHLPPAGYTCPDATLAGWKNPSDIEFGYFSSWSHMIVKVAKITKTAEGALIEMAQPGFFLSSRKGSAPAQAPAYIENALELLHEPGQWYFDRPARTLYYRPRPGQDMATAEVIAPRLETLVAVKGAGDLRFEGITFAHATWLRPSTALGHPDLQANFILLATNGAEFVRSPANVLVDAGQNVRFRGCTFTALGGAGLDLQDGAQSNVVAGCRFYDISGSAIQLGGVTTEDHHPRDPRRTVKDNRVVNNVITRIGVEYTGSIGVMCGYTDGSIIAHNDISEIPYTGISVGWGWGGVDLGGGGAYQTPTTCQNNRIEFNHIHSFMREREDGGGVYTLGCQSGTIIRGNHIHEAGPGWAGGVYLDEGSANIEVTSNLVYRVPYLINFHNQARNCLATCRAHDNYFTPPTTLAGKIGRALQRGSALDVPPEPRLDPVQFTVTAWVRLDGYPAGADPRRWVVCQSPNEFADHHLSLCVAGQNLLGYLNIGGGPANCFAAQGTGDPLPLHQWVPVAISYDGDTLRVYCAGKEVGVKKIGKARTPGTGAWTLGGRTDRRSVFDCGAMDEVRLYNRALSPDELRRSPDAIRDGLVQHWDFEKLPDQDVASKIADEAGLEPQYQALLPPFPPVSGPSRAKHISAPR